MELDDMLDDYQQRGIEVIAVSANSKELAEKSAKEWSLGRLTLGYGLQVDDARQWGLYVSKAIKETEPSQFVEPGLFVIRPDGTLFASIVQTMPFSRPPASALLKTLDFVIEKDYPARGEES